MKYKVKKIYKNDQENKTLVDIEFSQDIGDNVATLNRTLEFIGEENFDFETSDIDYFRNFIRPLITKKIKEDTLSIIQELNQQ
jgi:hypothetical protein